MSIHIGTFVYSKREVIEAENHMIRAIKAGYSATLEVDKHIVRVVIA